MKNSGSPPPAPDPTQTANAQSAANIQTAIANARLNRVNQTTPWGSINYTQGPVDANGVPTYSSNISLSPQQQALLEQQQSGQLTRAQLANQVLQNAGPTLAKPLDLSHLQSVYNPNSTNHQWEPLPASQHPQAAPPQAAPAMPGQPPQQGESAVGGQAAPSAQMAGAAPTNPGGLAALANMLRSGATTTPSGGLEGGSDGATKPMLADVPHGFGTAGAMDSYIGTSKGDLSKLPPEIAAQLQDEVKVDEGGTQTHNYNFNENPFGGFKGADGKYYVQVGQNKLKDPSKVKSDAAMGDITEADNVIDRIKPEGINYLMLAAALTAGAGGAALGLGGEAAGLGGAAAGEGLGAGTMTGLAGDESAGLALGGGAGSGAGGAAAGAGAAGSSGLAPLTGVTLGPEAQIGTMGSYGGSSPGIFQQMLQNAQGGRGLLGYGNGATQGIGSLLSQLLRNGGQGAQGGRK